jgi:hypothetical protein
MRYSNAGAAWHLVACLGVALVCGWLVGCGGSQKQSLEQESSHLKPLSLMYGQFMARNRGRRPANEEQFKQFVQSQGKEFLSRFNLESVDALFVSTRDNKPFVIIYGQPKGPPGPGGAPVIAYEQEGKDGMRHVASDLGAVELVDEARFRELVPGGP